jgi:hypothetical protein
MRKIAATIVVAAVLTSCAGGDDTSGDDASADSTPPPATSPTTEADATTTSSVADATTTTEATSTTEATTTTTVAAAVADAISIEPAVDVRVGTATAFTAITDPEPVAAGDTVRTDASGFAEIAYFDGSLTRLDVDTEFEVLELVDAVEESAVRTRMGLGRTWHRVESLGEGGEFSVETSVATAVVQGTAFSIACADETSCTFMVVEGQLRIDLPDGTSVDLVAPAALVVDAEGPGEPMPVPFDGAFGDEWLFDNGQRDVEPGYPSPAEIFQAHGPSYGSISGTFTGIRTVTALDCVTICHPETPPVGDVADRSYTFEIDCSGGIPCIGTIDTEYQIGAEVARATLPIEFDGTSYRWVLEYSGPSCFEDMDGDGEWETETGNRDTTIDWVMTPTAGEIVDDRWVVTDPAGCAGPDYDQGNTSAADIVVSRVP